MSPIRTGTTVVTDSTISSLQEATTIRVHTSGSTFTPVLILSGTGVVTWTFPDGTHSHATTLTVNWGTSTARETTLLVEPWSVLQRMNFGYDRGDGGSADIELVANCNVTSLENMELVAPTLGQLCLSHCQLETLDLSNFVNLDTLECYLSGIHYITLRRTHKLARICLEGNDLQFLDLSDCPAGADLRCAEQDGHLGGVEFGSCIKNWWHICCQTNTGMKKELPQPREHRLLQDYFIWNCQQHGDANGWIYFNTGQASVLHNVLASGNYYRHADFTNRFINGNAAAWLDMSHNLLETIILTGCTNVTTCLLDDNLLTEAQVDAVIAQLIAGAKTNGTLTLETGNATPSGTGITGISTLRSRGWTCSYSGEEVTLVSIAITPDNATVTEGTPRQYTATGTYSDASTDDLTTTVVWTSGNESYVTIAATGIATYVSAGSTTLTATSGVVHDDTNVTLSASAPAPTLSSIAVTPAAGTVVVDATRQYTATGTYSDASTDNITSTVTWDSSDDSHATISTGGLVTGVLESTSGEVVITATLGAIHGDTTLTISAVATDTITFTTDGQLCRPSCVAAGGTILWTIEGEGTFTTADAGAIDFGTAAHRTHTLTVSPTSALTTLSNHSLWVNSGVTTYTGLSDFTGITLLCEEGNGSFTGVGLDLTGVTNLTGVHFAGCNAITAESMDAVFIALDANGASSGSIFFVTGRFTSASATARSNLVTKLWNLYPG